MGKRRKWKATDGGVEPGKMHKITVNLEFAGSKPAERFGAVEFQALVDSAINKVLGSAAPLYTVTAFDAGSMRGTLRTDGADLHLLWAALSIYGMHFDQRLAFHMFAIHKE